MKRLIKVVIALILSLLFLGVNISNATDDKMEQTIVEVSYKYKEDTNTVIATIKSNNELKNTKKTWKLSEDKKQYTFEFGDNTTYMSSVVDKFGNTIPVLINVTQIDESPAKIKVSYDYNKDTNTVMTTMTSNRELQNTKVSWKLSEDKKQYTFEFGDNTKYVTNVVDRFGNVIPVLINVTDVDVTPAKVIVSYKYKEDTNTVIATMTSNRELQNTKISWKLSEDKKQYIFEFGDNTKYTTSVVDRFGNVIPVLINVTDVDETPTKVEVSYEYKSETNTVIATMIASRELRDTKVSWKLSEDKKKYTFEFGNNTTYMSSVVDKFGKTIPVLINVTQIDDKGPKIEIEYKYSENAVTLLLHSNEKMVDTNTDWSLSDDGLIYEKTFYEDQDYILQVKDVYGNKTNVEIYIDYFFEIITEKGTYGVSGAKVNGVNGGSDLEYYRFGSGENVLFATFCVHGYEDSWDRDGEVLVNIANDFYNKLIKDQDKRLAKNWTIYILKEVNPDGRRLGYTNYGPGRTTLYSKVGKGIDLNRSWQTSSEYKIYTSNRNYNGTEGFQAYEAEYLRDFLLSHKSQNGKTVLVDLHGWENQLIGDEEICKYYKEQYTSCRTTNYGKYGTQYMITWGREILGAKVALVELPLAANQAEVNSMGLSEKYIDATLEMLKNEKTSINTKKLAKKTLSLYDNSSINYKIAFSGMINGAKPSYEEIDFIYNDNKLNKNGIWINPNDKEKILKFLNNCSELNNKYYIDENNYLNINKNTNATEKDNKIEKLINGEKKYLFNISSICYMLDTVTGQIVDNPYNELDRYQTYEYFKNEDEMLIFITENEQKIYTDIEIFNSIMYLLDIV